MMTGIIEWHSATLTLPGQSECGDRCVVKPIKEGVLVAVVDGLGHGHEAALAAEQAIAIIENRASAVSLPRLVEQCHAELRGARGVVMSLALFKSSERMMAWLGIGNVEGRLLRKSRGADRRHESLLLRPGVVGERLPALRTLEVPMVPGDVVVFATDGIKRDFAEDIDVSEEELGRIAKTIVACHSKGNDDALVLVARYGG